MTIRINLDVMMAKRKIGVGELAEQIGITPANVSILKNGRAKAVRFTTLDALQGPRLPARRHSRMGGQRLVVVQPIGANAMQARAIIQTAKAMAS